MIECTMQLTPRYIWKLTNYSLKLSRPLVIWRRICIIVSPLLAADALYQILIEIKAFWIFELVISLAILVYSIWGIKIVLYIKSYRIYKKKGAVELRTAKKRQPGLSQVILLTCGSSFLYFQDMYSF